MGKQQSRGTVPTLHGDGENSEKVNTGRFGIGFGFLFASILFLYFWWTVLLFNPAAALVPSFVFTFGLLVPGSASLLLSPQTDRYLRPFLFPRKVKTGSETNLTAFLTRSF